MTYEVRWVVLQRVLEVQYTNHITLDELTASQDELYNRIDSGIAPVHVLVLTDHSTHFPRSVNAIKQSTRIKPHANSGWVLCIMPNAAQRFMSRMLVHLMKSETRFFDHRDAAWKHLLHNDTSLRGILK